MAFVNPLPRLMALVAWTLAVTVAAGVATPRLRAAGRERVVRPGLTRSCSWRSDGARGWVLRAAAPSDRLAADPGPSVASSAANEAALASPATGLSRPVLTVAGSALVAAASLRPSSLPVRAGRAPPLA